MNSICYKDPRILRMQSPGFVGNIRESGVIVAEGLLQPFMGLLLVDDTGTGGAPLHLVPADSCLCD